MAGILFALQINNWNEEARLNRKEVDLLNSLRENLAENLNDLNKGYANDTSCLIVARKLVNHLVEDRENNDSLGWWLHSVNNGYAFNFNNAAYKSIESFGIDLIDNQSIRQKITAIHENDYRLLKQERERLIWKHWEFMFHYVNRKYLFYDGEGTMRLVNYKAFSSDQEVLNNISYYSGIWSMSLVMIRKAISSTEQLIFELEQEIDHRR